MKKQTKVILVVAGIAALAYLTRDKWMPKKEEKTSPFWDTTGGESTIGKSRPKGVIKK